MEWGSNNNGFKTSIPQYSSYMPLERYGWENPKHTAITTTSSDKSQTQWYYNFFLLLSCGGKTSERRAAMDTWMIFCDWDGVWKSRWLGHVQVDTVDTIRIVFDFKRLITVKYDKANILNPSKLCYQLSFDSSIERHARNPYLSSVLLSLKKNFNTLNINSVWFFFIWFIYWDTSNHRLFKINLKKRIKFLKIGSWKKRKFFGDFFKFLRRKK